jgi:hypothetical protein
MMVEVETTAIARKIHELLTIAEAAALETAARVVEEDYKRSPQFFDCSSVTSRIRALQPGGILKEFEDRVRDEERRNRVPATSIAALAAAMAVAAPAARPLTASAQPKPAPAPALIPSAPSIRSAPSVVPVAPASPASSIPQRPSVAPMASAASIASRPSVPMSASIATTQTAASIAPRPTTPVIPQDSSTAAVAPSSSSVPSVPRATLPSVRPIFSDIVKTFRPSTLLAASKNGRPHGNWYAKTLAWFQGSI